MRWWKYLLAIATFALCDWPAGAQTIRASVLSIGDGDTLRVREGNLTVNLRLACMMPLRPTRHPLVLRPGNN